MEMHPLLVANDTSRKLPLQKNGEETPKQASTSHYKHEKCAQKLEEVEAVVKQLREKHGTAYSTERLNCWAHMIHLGKHSCLDEPPDLPFFGKHKKTEDKSSSNERACNSNTLSPGEKSPCEVNWLTSLPVGLSCLRERGH